MREGEGAEGFERTPVLLVFTIEFIIFSSLGCDSDSGMWFED